MTSSEQSKGDKQNVKQDQNLKSTSHPKTNVLAIASLVAAFFIPIVGLILSIVALNQIKKTSENGRSAAIAGLVISIVVMIFHISLIILMYLIIASAPKEPVKVKTNQNTTTQSQQQTTESPKYIINLPDLIGKNIDEIRAVLGQPKDGELTDPTPIQAEGASQWDNTFVIKNKELLVTYNPNTKKVIDFFVPTPDVANKAELLVLFNLEDGESSYTIKEVKAIKDPSKITGFTITPLN